MRASPLALKEPISAIKSPLSQLSTNKKWQGEQVSFALESHFNNSRAGKHTRKPTGTGNLPDLCIKMNQLHDESMINQL